MEQPKKRRRVSFGDIDSVGKIPPQDVPLEEVILGALLISKEAMGEIESLLTPRTFYKDNHGLIFKAIQELHKRKDPIDILTCTAELRKQGNLEQVGGAFAITQLTERVASSANILTHARIIVEKFISREVIRIAGEYTTMAFEDETDPFDMLDDLKRDLAEVESGIEVDDSQSFVSLLRTEIAGKRKEIAEGKPLALSTGNPELDDLISGGFRGSKLYVVGAKESGGKSARGLAMSKAVAVAGVDVLVESIEMSARDYCVRFIIEQSSVLSYKYHHNLLDEYDWKQIDFGVSTLERLNIHFRDKGRCTPNKIRKDIKSIFKRTGRHVKFVMVDYIQLMHSDEKTGNREQEIASISREMKSIAKEFDIPVLVLAQINRESEKEGGAKRPKLHHLRESAALGQDGDVVMFVYRPYFYFPYGEHPDEMYSKNNMSENEYEIQSQLLIAKNREGEAHRVVNEIFKGKIMRFEPKSKKDESDPFLQEENDNSNSDIIPF